MAVTSRELRTRLKLDGSRFAKLRTEAGAQARASGVLTDAEAKAIITLWASRSGGRGSGAKKKAPEGTAPDDSQGE